jgi:hypothetical protein
MNKRLLYYGKDEPLPERVPLCAGPLSMIYENGDLRYVRLGNKLALLRLYWAVRDSGWGTVSNVISNVAMDVKPDAFHLSYDATCQDANHGIDFRARVTMVGEADGSISAEMDGTAHSTFMRNRLGFCVLHPAEQAGCECIVEHVDGNSEQAKLPKTIYAYQPVEPFSEMRGLRVKLGKETWINIRLNGDTFEMEDQRNWTDASYKTFCTPLRLPYPVEVKAGTRVRQTVSLRVEGDKDKGTRQKAHGTKNTNGVYFSILNSSFNIPALGVGQRYAGKALTGKQAERLRALKLKHLRVDLNLGEANVVRELQRATRDSAAVGAPLQAALYISPDNAAAQLRALSGLLEMLGPQVSHWLIYPAIESQVFAPPVRVLVEAARAQLGSYNKKAQFFAGTDADFIFANKQAHAYKGVAAMDGFCVCSNPQVHAFDNASLAETLAAQSILVQSAKKLVQNKPVLVSPMTLRPRWNAYVTGAAIRGAPLSDVRQTSLFGAGWLLGSLKYLAEAGAAGVTYFETVGERGLMDTSVYPMWHVLADVGEFAKGEVVASKSSEPLKVEGLVLRIGTRGKQRTRLMLANMTDEVQTILLKGLRETWKVKKLDETNAVMAMKHPEKFRAQAGEAMKTANGKLEIELLPFALVRIDGGQLNG